MARVDTTWWYHNWRLDWCGNFNGWRLNRDKLNSWVISSHSNLYGFMISFCLWLAAPVCHPPPPPPICLFHTSNIVRWLNELEDCQNNRHVDFILFFASNSVWSEYLGKWAEREKKCSYIWSQMCVEENVPHNRGLYGTLVLARSQRCPPRAAVLLKTVFFFFFLATSRSVLALWASDKGCSELSTHTFKIRWWILATSLKNSETLAAWPKEKWRATKYEQLLVKGKMLPFFSRLSRRYVPISPAASQK